VRVLLVSPPYYKPYAWNQVRAESAPLGLGYLAAYLRQQVRGVEVHLVDYGVAEYSDARWRTLLESGPVDVVGFSVLTLGYKQCVHMARLLRESAPSAVVVMGGPHATLRPEECKPYADYVVRGEGERVLVDIVRGCGQRHYGRETNLDALPYPDISDFDASGYAQYPAWGVISSRGCPYSCIFCASPALWQRRVYVRSPGNIVDEIERLQQHGIQRVIFQDDAINLTPERAIEISREIRRRGLHRKMMFDAQVRANRACVSLAMFQEMREAGFDHVTIGVETGSERVMRELRKSLTVPEASAAVRLARQADISVSGFFMVGNWGEGMLDVARTWWFVARHDLDMVLTVCTPLPGTEFESRLRRAGYLKGDPDWARVTWVTPITRTDRMPRWLISLVYYLTVLLVHIPAQICRRHKWSAAQNALRYAWRCVWPKSQS